MVEEHPERGVLLQVEDNPEVPESDTIAIFGPPGCESDKAVVWWRDHTWFCPVADEMKLLLTGRHPLLMGFKGNSTLDSGYFYAPYVPIMRTPKIGDDGEPYQVLLEPHSADATGYELMAAWRVLSVIDTGGKMLVEVDAGVEEPDSEPLAVFALPDQPLVPAVVYWRDAVWTAQLSDLERLVSGEKGLKLDPASFSPRKGILTRYGKKILAEGAKYYQKISISNFTR